MCDFVFSSILQPASSRPYLSAASLGLFHPRTQVDRKIHIPALITDPNANEPIMKQPKKHPLRSFKNFFVVVVSSSLLTKLWVMDLSFHRPFSALRGALTTLVINITHQGA